MTTSPTSDSPAPRRVHGLRAEREQLFARHLGLARHFARRYHGRSEPAEDLMQIACVGLIKAVDRFDPDRGFAFASFAAPYITGELRRHFRDRSWAVRAPRRLKDLSFRIDAARPRLTGQLGRAPTIAQLAEDLACQSGDVLDALELAHANQLTSYDADGDEDDAPAPMPGEVDDGFARAEDRALLGPLLGALSDLDREVLRLRFADDLTQCEIAERVGVSQMQVSRRLTRSIETLRGGLAVQATGLR